MKQVLQGLRSILQKWRRTAEAPTAGVGGTGHDAAPPPILVKDLDPLFLEEPESYPSYLENARRRGMDVNDYIEEVEKHYSALPFLEAFVFPHLRPDSCVVEVGPGTGRFAREVVKRIPDGELYLVDFAPWLVQFLTDYFAETPRIHVRLNDGISLPPDLTGRADVIYSFGVFVLLKLGIIYSYAREFCRVLKPGGCFVLEYVDISSHQGWSWLEGNSCDPTNASSFTYFTPEVIENVFAAAGLEILYDDYGEQYGIDHYWRILAGRRPPAGGTL